MRKKSLAIIIPAFKIDFFKDTLDSLAQQTCKDFTVYIGDDASPADFKSLVDKYDGMFDFVYQRFPTNMGGHDLVGQWNRCLNLTRGEPWLWLFSDDDILGSRCVELFYREIENADFYDIYHFNVKVIDSKNRLINDARPFPTNISSIDFYKNKCANKLDSFVVEYIFSRKTFENIGGFQKYDMAWGSDLTTWCILGKNSSIHSIDGEYVYWRKSNVNITPTKSNGIAKRKFLTDVDVFAWANTFFKKEKIKLYNEYFFFRHVIFYSKSLSKDDLEEIVKKAKDKFVIGNVSVNAYLKLFPILKAFKSLRDFIRNRD